MMGFCRNILNRFYLLAKICYYAVRLGVVRLAYRRKLCPAWLYYLLLPASKNSVRGLSDGERLCRLLVKLGGSFIKFGQILSVRPDIVGEDIADALRLLQDSLPPFSFKLAQKIIEKNSNRKLNDMFQSFDEVPIATASIAQIHRATLITGEDVAVKILRPNVKKLFKRDIDLLHALCRYLEYFYPKTRLFKFREIVETYQGWIKKELNLWLELSSCKELRLNLADEPKIIIPKPFPQYSNESMLVIEWVSGIKIDDRQALIKAGHDPHDIIQRAVELFFLQVFRDGFFHADIHPGNLFIQQDGALAAVDFGITGRLDKQTRFFLADILIGFIHGDYDLVAQVHFDMGYVPPHHSKAVFADALKNIGEPLFGSDVKTISFAEMLFQMINLARKFDMQPQLTMLLLHKTMLQAEGIGRILVPGMNIWMLSQPLIEEWLLLNRNPLTQLRQWGINMMPFIINLPKILQHLATEPSTASTSDTNPNPPSSDSYHAAYAHNMPANIARNSSPSRWRLPIGVMIGFLSSAVLFSHFLLP